MPNYVIIAPQDSTLNDRVVHSKFQRAIAIRPDSSWAVSTPHTTCADVREHLVGSGADGPKTLCVVVKATEYNGYAKRDLWEKLEAWERS